MLNSDVQNFKDGQVDEQDFMIFRMMLTTKFENDKFKSFHLYR